MYIRKSNGIVSIKNGAVRVGKGIKMPKRDITTELEKLSIATVPSKKPIVRKYIKF